MLEHVQFIDLIVVVIALADFSVLPSAEWLFSLFSRHWRWEEIGLAREVLRGHPHHSGLHRENHPASPERLRVSITLFNERILWY